LKAKKQISKNPNNKSRGNSMSEVLFLSRVVIEKLIDYGEAINIVERAFAEDAEGKHFIYPVIREEIHETEGVFGIKSGYIQSTATLGLKAGGYWNRRIARGLPGHQSTILLFDPDSGSPLCVMDGNYITEVRTAAAGAVAVKHLARKDADEVGVIGTGIQGRAQLIGLSKVVSIRRVRCFDIRKDSRLRYADDMKRMGLDVTPVDEAKSAVDDADVVITATPSTEAIVMDDWIKPGVHINAMGADTRGKQELEETIFKRAKIVVDNLKQCLSIGECQHAFSMGIIKEEDVYATLGEIVSGRKPGRTNELEITLFDSTGVTFQDLSTAEYVFRRAVEKGVGSVIKT